MPKQNDHILIVGGGTAGWLTAAILAKSLHCSQNSAQKITLVESPDIPILGVGEGTWPNLRATLRKIGVKESDFIKECDATFKQGAEFVNWSTTPDTHTSSSYYHPLSTVNHSSYDFNLAPYWLLQDENSRLPYDKAVSSQARICDLGLAPKQIVMPEYSAAQEYAYHLNANKFAEFIKQHCIKNLSVNFISANVTKVNLDQDDFISHVDTDHQEHKHIKADFFIDCSGARGLIINQTYKIGWVDISHIILNNTALAVQVPYATEQQPIKTHTLSTAQSAGWIWDIGLQTRRGVGHVFSSQHISEDEATSQLINYIAQPDQDLTIRKLKLNNGYREKFWHKNSVAIGMSAGFVEPLEASAIFLLDAAANMIAAQFPRQRQDMAYVENNFNRHFTMRMQRSVEFIKLHYCISKRRDSQYWIDNCQPDSIPDNLKRRLAFWENHAPTKYDFDNAWEPFNLDSYLYVLYGMGFKTDLKHNQSAFVDTSRAQRYFSDVSQATKLLSEQLPKQRELIEKVCQFGFSRV
ncbi:tryptophan halogenase family protein [Paraglaciecola sp.]|uniref:tryptophan halogenase family protein n=1 Tax=Paraglaciecola sp. TaxID=1920173 RepID=UPI0030F43715